VWLGYEEDRGSCQRCGGHDFPCSLHLLQPFPESSKFFLRERVYGSPGHRTSFLEVDLAIIRSMPWESVGGFFSHYSQKLPEFHAVGTFFSGSSSTADTYPITRVLGSVATNSSQDSEYWPVSYLVHSLMHLALSNRIFSFVQVPWGGCAVIQSKGRKASMFVSIGDILNFSLE